MEEPRTTNSSTAGPAVPAARHGRHMARVGFGISRVSDPALEVRETELAVSAFHVLVEFDCPGRRPRGTVVLPPPISGVLPLIMRETVLALLPRFRVLVPDWINPRFIPLRKGSFGLDANIAAIIGALRAAGPGAGLVALCQSGTPSVAAAAVMAAQGDPAAPPVLALLGSPIDPKASPTSLSRHLAGSRAYHLQSLAITPVRHGYPGVGRLVYSADTQESVHATARFRRAFMPGWLSWTPFPDMGEIDRQVPLSDLCGIMMDVDARHFLENIDAVFRRRALVTGGLFHEGVEVNPAAIRDCALLAVEGAEDRIVAPGQTAAALALCPDADPARRRRLLARGCNHLALFGGEQFQHHVAPPVIDWLDRWLP
ncbi:polyhydroxyalkanoate depolymerase [Paracoccus alkenifer]|uniref:Poly(3-hydroxybutyrate) depolymerase n=1 Tax=Paracoccus alkenifer TaxID=65735 RepID=A0A1H6MMJ0_9RHOB|nr:polyhydroxyalkanoate depolymerase [Paracoccus alkenifer]SEI03023.1 poly(3-hydroxybutyrate) depolymerase [Paracoccus alkenifer]